MLFLNQQKSRNGRRKIFMTKSSLKNVSDVGINLGVTCFPSGLSTVSVIDSKKNFLFPNSTSSFQLEQAS